MDRHQGFDGFLILSSKIKHERANVILEFHMLERAFQVHAPFVVRRAIVAPFAAAPFGFTWLASVVNTISVIVTN